MKGADSDIELEEAKNAINVLGGKLEKIENTYEYYKKCEKNEVITINDDLTLPEPSTSNIHSSSVLLSLIKLRFKADSSHQTRFLANQLYNLSQICMICISFR